MDGVGWMKARMERPRCLDEIQVEDEIGTAFVLLRNSTVCNHRGGMQRRTRSPVPGWLEILLRPTPPSKIGSSLAGPANQNGQTAPKVLRGPAKTCRHPSAEPPHADARFRGRLVALEARARARAADKIGRRNRGPTPRGPGAPREAAPLHSSSLQNQYLPDSPAPPDVAASIPDPELALTCRVCDGSIVHHGLYIFLTSNPIFLPLLSFVGRS
jgi:hypothetical protein